MNDDRGPWYLLTGLVIGAALGLIYAWVVQPRYAPVTPATLRAEAKDQYRMMIAAAYQSDGDIVRARARLNLLKDSDMYRSLAEQAQRTLSEGRSLEEARALGLLAVALGQVTSQPAQGNYTLPPRPGSVTAGPKVSPTITPTPSLPPTSTPEPSATHTETLVPTTVAPTNTPAPTHTPTLTPSGTPPSATPTSTITPTRRPLGTPTRTPTPTGTLGAPYTLKSRERVCSPLLRQPLMQVEVYDAAGRPVPGMEIVITWEGGEQRFFTGLKPDRGLGYADYTLTPGVTYTVRLPDGEAISGLTPVQCGTNNAGPTWGAWRLVFTQPK